MSTTDGQLAALRALREATTDPAQRAALDTAIAALVPPAPPLVSFGTNNQMGNVQIRDVVGRDQIKGIEGTTNVSGTVHGAAVGVNLGTIVYSSNSATPAPTPAEAPMGAATTEQLAAQRERLAVHRNTLATLLNQQATFGSAYTPPVVMAGIREAREAIYRIKTTLRGWGVTVDDGPDDL